MKKFYLLPYFLILFISCDHNDQEPPEPTDFGYLSMNVSVEITSEPANGRVTAVPTDDWKVTIFDASDDSEEISFDPYSSAPTEIQLPTGEYYIEAHSNNFQEAAFENPYYFGRSDDFTIDKEELKTIDIDAELANSKVVINYSSNITSTFNSYSGEVTVVSSGTSLAYAQGETREGYFVSEPLSVVVDLSYTKQDGSFITRQFTADIDAEPKTLYNVNIDATLEDGKIVININVDEDFGTVDIDLGDTGADPNVNWIAGEDWVDERDGEVYGTAQIGDQVWMSENLRATQYTDGSPIPFISSVDQWSTLSSPGYSWYNDDQATYETPNGAYYNFFVIQTDNVCPQGWRVPEYYDWEALEGIILQEGNDPTSSLKADYSWIASPNGTNIYGFSAVAAGARAPSGAFRYLGQLTYWWVNASDALPDPYSSGITSSFFPAGDYAFTVGINVRCIKEDDSNAIKDTDGDGIPDKDEVPFCVNNPGC